MRFDPQETRREVVRGAVRGLLEQSPEFARLPQQRRMQLARDLVDLTSTSVELIAEEVAADPVSARQLAQSMGDALPVAEALEDPSEFNPAANRALSEVARDTLDGIAFPRFVTELVNGVFKGLIDANAQQIQAYVDMISGVTAASADSSSSTGPDQARLWLVQQFPDSYELGASTDDWGEEEENGSTVVRLREGKDGPPPEDVALLLELEGEEAEGFDTQAPEEGLLGKVRAYLSRKRQKVIASLLTLGINRLVIDHGKIKAGMNFSIDAHSAAEENRARRSEFKHSSTVGGSVGIGPWSVNASMTNSIGIVNTSQAYRREDMNQQVNMNADVELHFHSDYLPLNQFAAQDSVARIQAVSVNPDALAPQSAARAATRQRDTSARYAVRTVANTPINFTGAGTPPPIRRSDANDDSQQSRDRRAQDRRQDAAAGVTTPTRPTTTQPRPPTTQPTAPRPPTQPTPPTTTRPTTQPTTTTLPTPQTTLPTS